MSSSPDFSMEYEASVAEAVQFVNNQLLEFAQYSQHEPPLTTFPGLPRNFQQTDGSLSNPCMVSIGRPYDNEYFLWYHKLRLLDRFLKRNSGLYLVHYIVVLMNLVPETPPYGSHSSSLAVLFLLDGCFILELFLTWLNEESDVLLREHRGQRLILSDLLLFNNQIPFAVIDELFALVFTGQAAMSNDNPEYEEARGSFYWFFAKFLMNEKPKTYTPRVTQWPNPIVNLLDLYDQYLIATTNFENVHPRPARKPKHRREEKVSVISTGPSNDKATAMPRWERRLRNDNFDDPWDAKQKPRIPCATELHEVGIEFRKKHSPKSLLDVTFSGGILEIPLLQFDNNKRILFYNLIAQEKEKKNSKDRIVTSYILLMDSLIDTKADIELLQRSGVIHNMLSSHHKAAVVFNQLGGSLSIDTEDHHFAELFSEVQSYYDFSWNRHWARLMRDYFNSPWTIMSIIAGLIIIILTALQTFYTAYPYWFH